MITGKKLSDKKTNGYSWYSPQCDKANVCTICLVSPSFLVLEIGVTYLCTDVELCIREVIRFLMKFNI